MACETAVKLFKYARVFFSVFWGDLFEKHGDGDLHCNCLGQCIWCKYSI